ncbi:hypothetical protein JTB14_031867 [Gonioctena quinquepunctata]|nr:hypothetical protein JTB14_031867 [Gonioctena quinquepunctata]
MIEGRVSGPNPRSIGYRPLDFVLDNAIDDERPYLRVDILGKTLMGLLTLGLRTILGGKGFELIEDLGLVLGADFWKAMGIVPNLRTNEWHFSREPVLINSMGHVKGQTMLSEMEKLRPKPSLIGILH